MCMTRLDALLDPTKGNHSRSGKWMRNKCFIFVTCLPVFSHLIPKIPNENEKKYWAFFGRSGWLQISVTRLEMQCRNIYSTEGQSREQQHRSRRQETEQNKKAGSVPGTDLELVVQRKMLNIMDNSLHPSHNTVRKQSCFQSKISARKKSTRPSSRKPSPSGTRWLIISN